ncbi:uncharacterized protein LOC142337836 isoform X2 [Convolutriloba macropyga]|uniref:uncharacterized protein LOC142337836 isoform X2 n=1 Tax=Convolutriloba macropyga TaxID=536237 RepID=UPI003F524E60
MSDSKMSSSTATTVSSTMGKCLDRLRSVKKLVFNRNQSIKLTLQDTSVTLSNIISPTRTIETLNDNSMLQSEIVSESYPSLVSDSQHEAETTEQGYPSRSATDIDSLDDLINLMDTDATSYNPSGKKFGGGYNQMGEFNSDSGFASEELAIAVGSASTDSNLDRVQNRSVSRKRHSQIQSLQHRLPNDTSEASVTHKVLNDTRGDWKPFGVEWEWEALPDGGVFRNGDVLLTIEEVEEGELIGAIGREITPGTFEELSVGELTEERNFVTVKSNLIEPFAMEHESSKTSAVVKSFYEQSCDEISSLTTVDSDFVEDCLLANSVNQSRSGGIWTSMEECGLKGPSECSERTSIACSWSDGSSYIEDSDFSVESSLGIYEQIPLSSGDLLDHIPVIP